MIAYNMQMIMEQNRSETFNLLPVLWFSFAVPVLFGIYLSFLFIKNWSLKINVPLLLCVSLPCLILSMYTPVVSTVAMMTSSSASLTFPVPFWMLEINHLGIVSFVGGFSLFISLFGFDQAASIKKTPTKKL
jgi:hypothetical protein